MRLGVYFYFVTHFVRRDICTAYGPIFTIYINRNKRISTCNNRKSPAEVCVLPHRKGSLFRREFSLVPTTRMMSVQTVCVYARARPFSSGPCGLNGGAEVDEGALLGGGDGGNGDQLSARPFATYPRENSSVTDHTASWTFRRRARVQVREDGHRACIDFGSREIFSYSFVYLLIFYAVPFLSFWFCRFIRNLSPPDTCRAAVQTSNTLIHIHIYIIHLSFRLLDRYLLSCTYYDYT